ncbi:hypothetical protein, partial [Ralstonia pseudosolanacearum]|uniref:hypothetical protein n=1 Tax=Ralstonia pseudosolanacearum TaxID=1310165 RepID=UPI003CF31615
LSRSFSFKPLDQKVVVVSFLQLNNGFSYFQKMGEARGLPTTSSHSERSWLVHHAVGEERGHQP